MAKEPTELGDQKANDFDMAPVVSTDIKPGFMHLHIPEDLNGKTVLELFSGRDEVSLREELEKRGARYTSVDLYNATDSDFHFHADANTLLPFGKETFDYILMSGPPVWETDYVLNVSRVFKILSTCLPLLKIGQGNFIGILIHLDKKNMDLLLKKLEKDGAFEGFEGYFEETTIPATDRYSQPKGGYEYAFRLIRE